MTRASVVALLFAATALTASATHHHSAHHYEHHNKQVADADYDVDVADYYEDEVYDYDFDVADSNDDDLYDDDVYDNDVDIHVQTGTWNVAGTKKLIKEFEGLRLTAYRDSVGVLTIGYGHTGSDVHAGMTITAAQADALLEKDLGRFVNCVTSYVKVPLNPNQNGALVSFSFNLGCGSLQSSTLLRRLNNHENPNTVASEEMPKWNKAGGKVLPGLVRRRAAEVAFFKS